MAPDGSAEAAGEEAVRVWVGTPLRVVRGLDRATIDLRNNLAYDGLLVSDRDLAVRSMQVVGQRGAPARLLGRRGVAVVPGGAGGVERGHQLVGEQLLRRVDDLPGGGDRGGGPRTAAGRRSAGTGRPSGSGHRWCVRVELLDLAGQPDHLVRASVLPREPGLSGHRAGDVVAALPAAAFACGISARTASVSCLRSAVRVSANRLVAAGGSRRCARPGQCLIQLLLGLRQVAAQPERPAEEVGVADVLILAVCSASSTLLRSRAMSSSSTRNRFLISSAW